MSLRLLRNASPRNTPPPGDPSGGVVYLRNEILSLQKALCLFLNMDVLHWTVLVGATDFDYRVRTENVEHFE